MLIIIWNNCYVTIFQDNGFKEGLPLNLIFCNLKQCFRKTISFNSLYLFTFLKMKFICTFSFYNFVNHMLPQK
jgi:hypothetical protein